MNQNLESQMFQAGASQRMAELADMEKSAGPGVVGWLGRGAGFVERHAGRAANKFAPKLQGPGIVRPSLASAANNPRTWVPRPPTPATTSAASSPWLKPALGGAAVGGGLGGLGMRYTAHTMNEAFDEEAQKGQQGFKDMLAGYGKTQGFTDKLKDLMGYMVNGETFANNKFDAITAYAAKNQEKYFSPRMRQAMAPTFNRAAKIN